MHVSKTLHIFRPNVNALGYGLFLAINAASVWGGVFPFLPLGFQTPMVMLVFFLAQSMAFSLAFIASTLGVYYHPEQTSRFLVPLVAVLYILGWVFLIAALYIDTHRMLFVGLGGVFLGIGSAGYYMLWQRLFAAKDSDSGNHDLILGAAYGAVFYFALHMLPNAVATFLIPLVFLPLFSLAIVLRSRTIDRNQPMFEDIPHEHPVVYRQTTRNLFPSALCIGAVGLCTGIMRSLAIENPQIGISVNALSMAAMLVASAALLLLWQQKDFRFNIVTFYGVAFPFVITALLLLPFMGIVYIRGVASALYAIYSVLTIVMMIQSAQESRERGINPVFVYGFFGSVVFTSHSLGFVVGLFSDWLYSIPFSTPLMITAFAAIYLLGFMYFFGMGGLRKSLGNTAESSVELIALSQPGEADATIPELPGRLSEPQRSTQKQNRRPNIMEKSPASDALHNPSSPYKDRLSKQVDLVRQTFRLSSREAEVMELVARGNSVARIAEELVVSENTVRTHTKRIYAKLNVHKKQALVDLIESFNPRQLGSESQKL